MVRRKDVGVLCRTHATGGTSQVERMLFEVKCCRRTIVVHTYVGRNSVGFLEEPTDSVRVRKIPTRAIVALLPVN